MFMIYLIDLKFLEKIELKFLTSHKCDFNLFQCLFFYKFTLKHWVMYINKLLFSYRFISEIIPALLQPCAICHCALNYTDNISICLIGYVSFVNFMHYWGIKQCLMKFSFEIDEKTWTFHCWYWNGQKTVSGGLFGFIKITNFCFVR